MANLKVLNNEKLKDWAQEVFKKNSFNMIDFITNYLFEFY